MSASVFLSCTTAARTVSSSTVRLTLDPARKDGEREMPQGGMLILSKSSLPLYAIRTQETEVLSTPVPVA